MIGPIECVWPAQAGTGECPVWSVAEQALYWMDIAAPALHRFAPAGNEQRSWRLPEAIGCFCLMREGGLLLALRSGLYRFDPETEALERRAAAPYDPAVMRFNDGRCDAAGRFWLGTLRDAGAAGDAALYRYDARGLLRQVGGIGQSNGLGFSPDSRRLYHADTAAGLVRAYAYDLAAGALGPASIFARFAGQDGKPDGAAVDASGCYWIACHGAARIAVFRPDGSLLREIELPVSQPTMLAFGGPDLTTLFVTSERLGLDDAALAREPLAGALLRIESDSVGLPEPLFDQA